MTGRRSTTICTEFTEEEYTVIDAMAARQRRTKESIVRRMVRHELRLLGLVEAADTPPEQTGD